MREPRPLHPRGGVLVEELSIGVLDGPLEYQLGNVSDLLAARDGSVWVLESGTFRTAGQPVIRQYDSQGRYLRSIGRRGQGPGEFLAPRQMAQLGNGNVGLWDPGARRLLIYGEDGTPLQTRSLADLNARPDNKGFVAGADGTFHLALTDTDFGRNATRPISGPRYVRLSPVGAIIDTLPAPDSLPDISIPHVVVVGPRSYNDPGLPYSPRTVFVWNPGGFWITGQTNRSAFELRIPPRGSGGRSQWQVGDPVISVRWNEPPIPVGNVERNELAARLRAQISRFSPDLRREGPNAQIPSVKPRWGGVIAAPDGWMWVYIPLPSERYEPVDPAPTLPVVHWRSRWAFDVYQPGGELLGRVTGLGHDVRVVTMKGEIVWGIHTDEDGVQRVKRYRIVWR